MASNKENGNTRAITLPPSRELLEVPWTTREIYLPPIATRESLRRPGEVHRRA